MKKIIEISKNEKVYSDEYGIILLNSFVNRIKLTLSVDLKKFSSLEQTPITLVRPTEFSILEIEDDYGLSAYSSENIDIKYIEGNHITILENPKLHDLLNEYL